MSAGTVTTGAVVSTRTTVTVKLFCAVFPCESVALHVTVVWPTGNLLPEDGLHDGVSAPSTVSRAVAEKATGGPGGSGAVRVEPVGKEITGGVVSTRVTVTLKVALPALPGE